MIVMRGRRDTLQDMTDRTPTATPVVAADFGQALSSLLRRYLEGARSVVDDVPGGPRGFQVLLVSSEGVCGNQATIATRLGIDRTVMTYLVDDLEHAGLVERRPDPADRRARQILLTAKGEQVLAGSAAQLGDIERAVLAGLSADEAEVFRDLLVRAAGADAPPDVDHSACGTPPL
jgi:DNA-binding MarR family transcriptional regulator